MIYEFLTYKFCLEIQQQWENLKLNSLQVFFLLSYEFLFRNFNPKANILVIIGGILQGRVHMTCNHFVCCMDTKFKGTEIWIFLYNIQVHWPENYRII